MSALPDDPAGAALRGPHRHLALTNGPQAQRYPPEVSPFASLGPAPTAEAWRALAELPGELVALFDQPGLEPQAGWCLERTVPVLQMVATELAPDPEPTQRDRDIQPLAADDLDEMLALTALTQPGPFLADTIRFGGYLGIRRGGQLVAMAGRRLHPPGFIEVSAVCTDPAHRGAGLARRITAAVAHHIHAEGATPFLHVVPDNPARRVYEAIGFRTQRHTSIHAFVRPS